MTIATNMKQIPIILFCAITLLSCGRPDKQENTFKIDAEALQYISQQSQIDWPAETQVKVVDDWMSGALYGYFLCPTNALESIIDDPRFKPVDIDLAIDQKELFQPLEPYDSILTFSMDYTNAWFTIHLNSKTGYGHIQASYPDMAGD